MVISMDSPLPFNSTKSIMLCLISAATAPEKRCRSHRVESCAFEESSQCSFQEAEREGGFAALFYSCAGTHAWPKGVGDVASWNGLWGCAALRCVSSGWRCTARERQPWSSQTQGAATSGEGKKQGEFSNSGVHVKGRFTFQTVCHSSSPRVPLN